MRPLFESPAPGGRLTAAAVSLLLAAFLPTLPPAPSSPASLPAPSLATGSSQTEPHVVESRGSPSASYVALGDSFSSGEGAPAPGGYVPGTSVENENMCHRSVESYPYRAAGLASIPAGPALHACSGALIKDFFVPFPLNHTDAATRRPHNPGETSAQLAWLGPQTEVVTLTAGGNDVGFADVMGYCAQRRRVAADAAPCRDRFQSTVDAAIRRVGQGGSGTDNNLPVLYAAVRERAPRAEVFVLGYPRFFRAEPQNSCSFDGGTRQFTVGDMLWINKETRKLNSVIEADAAAAGLHYVDVYNAFEGHELCTGAPHLNGIEAGTRGVFHPNVEGHADLAAVLEKSAARAFRPCH